MSDVIEKMRKEIQERMEELRPAIDEYRKLEAADAALTNVANPPKRRGRPRRES